MESMEKHANNDTGRQESCGCQCATREQESTTVQASREESRPRRTYAPAVDLIENDSALFLIADIPGVPEGKVDLSIEKNILTLVAVPTEGVVAGKKPVYSEYGIGEYRRSFALAEEIDRDGISASLKNGVLRITLPKSAPVTKKISVSAG